MVRRRRVFTFNQKCVFPCFTIVATGTCAFGRKCFFLHDKRTFVQDVETRQELEHQVSSLLHKYRPQRIKASPSPANRADSPLSVSSGDSEQSWEEDVQLQHQQQQPPSPKSVAASNMSSLKDDIFFFPSMEVNPNPKQPQQQPQAQQEQVSFINAGIYLPTWLPEFKEVNSMWHHYLTCEPANQVLPVDEFYNPTRALSLVTQRPRLLVFISLSQGNHVVVGE